MLQDGISTLRALAACNFPHKQANVPQLNIGQGNVVRRLLDKTIFAPRGSDGMVMCVFTTQPLLYVILDLITMAHPAFSQLTQCRAAQEIHILMEVDANTLMHLFTLNPITSTP